MPTSLFTSRSRALDRRQIRVSAATSCERSQALRHPAPSKQSPTSPCLRSTWDDQSDNSEASRAPRRLCTTCAEWPVSLGWRAGAEPIASTRFT